MERKIIILLFMTIFGLLAICGSARAVDGSGLIAHWKFDESSGAVAYDSVGGNDGTLMNGPQWTTGQIDGALDFDGVDDYVNIGNDDSLKPPLPVTLSAWINLDGSGPWRVISLDNQRFMYCGIFLGLSAERNVGVQYGDGSGGSGPTDRRTKKSTTLLSLNTWYHVAAVVRGAADMDLYINGVDDWGTYSGSGGSLTYSDGDSWIGRGVTVWGSSYFDGTIDDMRIYDRPLSASEIEQLYQDGLAELVSLEIVGPNEVAEDFQTQYRAIAHYDNDGTRDVTASADWSVEPTDIADIDAGLLETEEIDKSQDVTVTAVYTEGEVAVEAEKAVTILPICPSGYALEFDGENDYVDCGIGVAFPVGNKDRTLMAWIKTTGTGYRLIICYGTAATSRAMALGQNSGRVFVSSWAAPQYSTSDFSINDGNWHHIAFVLDSQIGKVYVNGVLKDSRPFSTNTALGQSKIGSRLDGAVHCFNGLIDEVTIYNKALSAEEIYANLHTKLGGDEDGLVAYWDFDEGDGEIAGDSSGNANDGTIVGAAWVQSDAPVGICTPVAVDIKPGSCPNPLNVASRGVLPAAILGTEEFDVTTIDAGSIFLEGIPTIRTSYEDVATAVTDGNECECTTEGPDGYTDLTLRFRTQEVVEELINTPGGLAEGQTLALELRGELTNGRIIAGSDCVVLVGNVPRHLFIRISDINSDGVINMVDLAQLAQYWLESYEVEY